MNDFVIANNYHVDNTLHVSGPGAELKRFLNEKWATLNRAEIGIGEYSIDENTAESDIKEFLQMLKESNMLE